MALLPITLHRSIATKRLTIRGKRCIIRALTQTYSNYLGNRFTTLVANPIRGNIVGSTNVPFANRARFFRRHSRTGGIIVVLTARRLHITLTAARLPLHSVTSTVAPTLLRRIVTVLRRSLQAGFNVTRPHVLIYKLGPRTNRNNRVNARRVSAVVPLLSRLQTRKVGLGKPLPTSALFRPGCLSGTSTILTVCRSRNLPILGCRNFKHNIGVALNLPFVHASISRNATLRLTKHNRTSINDFVATLGLTVGVVIGAR